MLSGLTASHLLKTASAFKVPKAVLKQLEDFFVLGFMLRDQKDEHYRFLSVFQRMTLHKDQLTLLSLAPEDLDDFSEKEASQIYGLYA